MLAERASRPTGARAPLTTWLTVALVAAGGAYGAALVRSWLSAARPPVAVVPDRAPADEAQVREEPTEAMPAAEPGTTAELAPAAAREARLLRDLERRLQDMEDEAARARAQASERRAAVEQARLAHRARRGWLARGRDRAREDLQRWREEADPQVVAQVERGFETALARRAAGDYAGAAEGWRQAIEAAPDSPPAGNATMELALDQKRQGRYGDALRSAQTVLERHSEEHSLDGQAQGVRALVLTAEICASLQARECLDQVVDHLASDYPDAVLGSGIAAIDYVRGLQ